MSVLGVSVDTSMDFAPEHVQIECGSIREVSMDNSAAIGKLQALDGEQDPAQIGMIQK